VSFIVTRKKEFSSHSFHLLVRSSLSWILLLILFDVSTKWLNPKSTQQQSKSNSSQHTRMSLYLHAHVYDLWKLIFHIFSISDKCLCLCWIVFILILSCLLYKCYHIWVCHGVVFYEGVHSSITWIWFVLPSTLIHVHIYISIHVKICCRWLHEIWI